MEEARHSTSRERSQSERLAAAIAQQRSRIEEFLSAQQKRLEAAGDALAQQLEAAAKKVSVGRIDADRRREDLERQSQELDRQTEILGRFKEELYARQAEREAAMERSLAQQATLAEQIQRQQDELDKRLAAFAQRGEEIAEAENALVEQQRAMVVTAQDGEAQRSYLAQQQRRLEEELARLAAEREKLATRHAHTEGQRRRIAQELRNQRAAQWKEIDRHRREVEQGESEQLARLRSELAEAADQELQLRHEVEGQSQERSRLDRELVELGREREMLVGRLAEMESRLAEAERGATGAGQMSEDDSAEDFRRRYEMALDDLRELREENQSLEQKLAQAAAAPRAPAAGQRLDWETEKGRILAALESQLEGEEEETSQQRLRIEQVIETTERALASKDEELADLKRVLAEQSTSLSSVAVGAVAVGELLDKDAVILEERENIRRLKEEWHEKLRAAEVELSIERATLARQRIELEDKLRAVGATTRESLADQTALPGKPDRGRWLAHLGLRNPDKT